MSSMKSTPTQDFLDLCETLYGPVIDPWVVLEDVAKRQGGDGALRRNVERGSNAVGIAAGTLGLAGSLRDDRLAEGTGRVARALHATGNKMPKLAARIKSPKVRAAMAATAVGTQVANLGGDALIAGTLKPKKVEKRLVPTGEVDKAFRLPGINKVTAGMRRIWNPNMTPTTPKAPPMPGTRAAAKEVRVKNQRAMAAVEQKAQGADAATMLSTKSGKAATGVAVGSTGYIGAKKLGQRSSYEYVPDTYAKSDGEDGVVFKGHFVDFDDDKKQAFGWASVVKINGEPVIDRQGDYISIEDLETAAYTYVHKSRVGGDMHKRNGNDPHKVSDMIESIVYTDEKCKAMGLPDSFPRGWWVGYQIHDPETWSLVRKQGRTGFSIHGRGIRRDVDVDELMGAH